MKSKILFITILLAGFIMVSCNSKVAPDVSGTWTTQVKYKTELPADLNDLQGPTCGVMYSVQSDTLELSAAPDFLFKETLVQKIDSIEFTGEKPSYYDEKAVSSFVGYETVFSGKYNIKGKYIEFIPEEVTTADGNTMDYNDFIEYNERASDMQGHKEFELSEDKTTLTVSNTMYKREEK